MKIKIKQLSYDEVMKIKKPPHKWSLPEAAHGLF